jgi:phosphoserine phosphatase
VVVNPDTPLRRYADAAGWEILKFKRKELRK